MFMKAQGAFRAPPHELDIPKVDYKLAHSSEDNWDAKSGGKRPGSRLMARGTYHPFQTHMVQTILSSFASTTPTIVNDQLLECRFAIPIPGNHKTVVDRLLPRINDHRIPIAKHGKHGIALDMRAKAPWWFVAVASTHSSASLG
ncbi:MAG: hypothetical protein FWF31_11575 [Desulfobulbus sp.]|nr:hypothetical protein [Desulfobulbus sp.]